MKLKPTAKRRLNTLIEFMAALPKSANKHFSMSHWVMHRTIGHKHTADKDGAINVKTLTGCGTTACAAGWAATIPAFKKAGFIYREDEGFSIDPRVFFDLTGRLHDDLFMRFDVYTPKQWAKCASEVIKDYERRA